MKTKANRILIVEDNALTAANIAGNLEEYGYSVTGIAHNAAEALENIARQSPDLIIMDIDLGEGSIDGIELAAKINEDREIPVIYLTDRTDERTANRVMKIHHDPYLPKPFTAPVLRSQIELALKDVSGRKKNGNDFLFIKEKSNDQHKTKILLKDIYYIESDRAYCRVYILKPGDIKLTGIHQSRSMSSFTKQLPDHFVQVNRSCTVNIHHIDHLYASDITIGGTRISISNGHKAGFLRKLN